MDINIDRTSKQPIFKQIVVQVTTMSQRGLLRAGEKLPTERELAAEHDIARGTVKRAYDQLKKNGIVEVIQGKGTFVRGVSEDGVSGSQTIKIIDKYLDQLSDLNLVWDEIELCIAQELEARGRSMDKIKILFVDCCVESLYQAKRDVENFPGVEVSGLLLDDVIRTPELLLADFDLILSPESHITALNGIVPSITKKLIPVAAYLSQSTLSMLAELDPNIEAGLFLESKEYAAFLEDNFGVIGKSAPWKDISFACDSQSFAEYLSDKEALLVTEDYPKYANAEQNKAITYFVLNGGRLLMVGHTFDRGSMMYIEEFIRRVRIASSSPQRKSGISHK